MQCSSLCPNPSIAYIGSNSAQNDSPVLQSAKEYLFVPKLDPTLFYCGFTVHWLKNKLVSRSVCVGVVSKLETLDGEVRSHCLVKLMTGLLTIPVSNADSERGFSILREIYTDQRPSLSQETLFSLMTMTYTAATSQLY